MSFPRTLLAIRSRRMRSRLAARSGWSALRDLSLPLCRGRAQARRSAAWPWHLSSQEEKLHRPASRWVGRSPRRPSLSLAEARSPRYPMQTSSSLVSNKAYRPQKSPIPPFCPSHENDQRNRTDGRRAAPAPAPAPAPADEAGSSDCGPGSRHDLRPGTTKADVGPGLGRFARRRPPFPHAPRSAGTLPGTGRRPDRPQESSGASLAAGSGRRIGERGLTPILSESPNGPVCCTRIR